MDSARLLIDFDLAIAALFGSWYFSIGRWSIAGFRCMLDAGMSQLFSVGFWGIMCAFGWRVIEEEGGLGSIPGVGFIVFIKFDF